MGMLCAYSLLRDVIWSTDQHSLFKIFKATGRDSKVRTNMWTTHTHTQTHTQTNAPTVLIKTVTARAGAEVHETIYYNITDQSNSQEFKLGFFFAAWCSVLSVFPLNDAFKTSRNKSSTRGILRNSDCHQDYEITSPGLWFIDLYHIYQLEGRDGCYE